MDPNPPELFVVDESELPTRRRRRRRSASATAIAIDAEEISAFQKEPPSTLGVLAVIGIVIACVVLILLTGCAQTTIANGEVINGADYPVSNVHRLAPKLPGHIRRVALLPVSTEPGSSDMAAGLGNIEGILQSELDRLNVFEVVRISPEQMRNLSGQSAWSATDKLPADFLATFKKETGCDAVMFCRLTRYHAYPPMAIGWNLKLADVTDGQIWWAADEMFDLADRRVVNSARRYELNHQKYYQSNPLLADSRTVLISPRRLAAFSAAALFATLPER